MFFHNDNNLGKKIVLYGTGAISKFILSEFQEFNIVGILDPKCQEGTLYGQKILSISDLERFGVEVIVIAAKEKTQQKIYYRIKSFADNLGIEIASYNGIKLCTDSLHQETNDDRINQIEYLQSAFREEELICKIKEADFISFDLFDTLITRKTVDPKDIFIIMDERLKRKGIYVKGFYYHRICSEFSVESRAPSLHEIYNILQNRTMVNNEILKKIMQLEIQVEKESIIKRDKMVGLLNLAVQLDKKVSIISDTYLSEVILRDFLNQLDIKGYEKVLASCDHGMSKKDKLFESYCTFQGYGKNLHIGDNPISDYERPMKLGLDAFLIVKPIDRFMFYKNRFNDVNEIINFDDINIGEYIAETFNSPFLE